MSEPAAPKSDSATSKRPRRTYGRMVLSTLPTMLGMMAVMFALGHLGWLRGFETTALDSMLRIHANQPRSGVLLVTIDDEDYHDLFGGVSPLQPDKLREVLQAISAGGAKVIGVDVETSASLFAGNAWPEAVWARDGEAICESQAENDEACESEEIRRYAALGGDAVESRDEKTHFLATTPRTGLVIFPEDYDGVIRRYKRFFESPAAEPESKLAGKIDSLPWAIVKAWVAAKRTNGTTACPECDRIEATSAAEDEELVLNFAGDRFHFPKMTCRDLLRGAKLDYWSTKSPCRDAIVIVGGAYRAARDSYPTPVGRRFGMEIIAQAVESDIQGRGIRHVNHLLASLLEFINSLFLIFLTWRFPERFGARASMLTTVILSVLASYLSFHTGGLWFNFSAVLVATWIHILWEQSQERRELRHELDHVRAQLSH